MSLVQNMVAVGAVAGFALAVSTSVASAAYHQASYNYIAPACDNNARCSTASGAPMSSYRIDVGEVQRRKRHVSRVKEREQVMRQTRAARHHPTDANGSRTFGIVTVPTAFGFNIMVHPAYATKFQKFFALLKERGYKVSA